MDIRPPGPITYISKFNVTYLLFFGCDLNSQYEGWNHNSPLGIMYETRRKEKENKNNRLKGRRNNDLSPAVKHATFKKNRDVGQTWRHQSLTPGIIIFLLFMSMKMLVETKFVILINTEFYLEDNTYTTAGRLLGQI